MTTPSLVAQLTQARRRYLRARTDLCTALGLITTLHLPDVLKAPIHEAITDNQASIDYLTDVIRNLSLAATELNP